MRVDAQNAEYDVVIVGSGAGGGMSAYVLTMSGLKVLMSKRVVLTTRFLKPQCSIFPKTPRFARGLRRTSPLVTLTPR